MELLCHCLEQRNNWMNQRFLQLYHNKTEIIVYGSEENRIAISNHLESLSSKTKDQV